MFLGTAPQSHKQSCRLLLIKASSQFICILSCYIYIPLSCNTVLILRCSEHFCLPSQLMTVERLMLWNTKDMLRPTTAFWHGGETKSMQDRKIECNTLFFPAHTDSGACSLIEKHWCHEKRLPWVAFFLPLLFIGKNKTRWHCLCHCLSCTTLWFLFSTLCSSYTGLIPRFNTIMSTIKWFNLTSTYLLVPVKQG